jgi:pantothenate kinase
MPEQLASQEAALARIQNHLENSSERVLIGIIGKPGAGKSTLSKFLMAKLPKEFVTVVPMDGYHLSNKVLKDLKRADRKGAPDTFDVAGFISLVKRIRTEQTQNIYYPIFDRAIEESIAAQGVVTSVTKVVIIEGNYLLHDNGGWEVCNDLLDESWMVDVDDDKRISRLISRHIAYGKDPEAAKVWAKGTDEVNAKLIERGRNRADFVVAID